MFYRNFIKRALDCTFALGGLICLSPLFIILTVVGAIMMGGNPFFVQPRPGKNGAIFQLLKFRTMDNRRDGAGNLLPDNERLNGYGRFLRSTSLDELPQLLNVLTGSMALIGPRPLLVAYLPLYTPEQNRRHEVCPGITGWAQVHNRNLCLLSKKFEYDVWYVDHHNFKIDCKIMWLTFAKVFKRSDIGTGNNNMAEVDDLDFAKRMNHCD